VSALLATFLRELRAYFVSPLAYVVLFFLLVLHGIVFSLIVTFLSDPRQPAGRPFDYFFGGFPFWLIVLFAVPVITMRLVAEERKSGSIEVLMTAPISEGQVVGGKFAASLAFWVVLWLPTVLYAVILESFGDVDWGTLGAGYLGVLLLGSFFLSIGVMTSALTRNQIVAAVAAFSLSLFVFFVGFVTGLVDEPWLQELTGYVSVIDHMDELRRGIVDTRRLVYYLSGTFFFLFVAARALEDRKWR
jgi:ABC-2 type transport system permease protein